jgi:hypothetical protein
MDYLDKLKSHPYISENVTINIYQEPYKHIIIDNLFKPEIYEKISKKLPELIARRDKPHGQVGSNPNLIYDAIIYGLIDNDCSEGFDFFIDPFWKNYLSELLGIIYNQHTAYAAHFHKGSIQSPSRNGWTHRDIGICSAIDTPNKEVKIISDCEYADDSNLQPHTTKIIRSTAILFYINNIEIPTLDDGGGTGVFKDMQFSSLVKTVLPINNRIFAFEISPESYHAFIGAKFDRSTLIQWFHSNPSYYFHKHLDKFKNNYRRYKYLFERWKKDNLWNLEQDPEYSKYFDKPVNEIINNDF